MKNEGQFEELQEEQPSRRSFLKIAGAAAVGLGMEQRADAARDPLREIKKSLYSTGALAIREVVHQKDEHGHRLPDKLVRRKAW